MSRATVRAAMNRPLARSSRSVATTVAIIDDSAVRCSVAPVLMRNATAYSSGTLGRPVATASARQPITAPHVQSTTTITTRRSHLSTRPPLRRLNNRNGSMAANSAPETTSGSPDIDASSSGTATLLMPLPSAEMLPADHSRVNRWPRRSVDMR